MTPALADSIDEIVINTSRRNDGIFMGFRAFVGRLSVAVQAVAFWLVQELTGFDNEALVQDVIPSAITGIHIHTAVIPACLLVLGVIVFYFLNTLTPEKVQSNREKLKELNL